MIFIAKAFPVQTAFRSVIESYFATNKSGDFLRLALASLAVQSLRFLRSGKSMMVIKYRTFVADCGKFILLYYCSDQDD